MQSSGKKLKKILHQLQIIEMNKRFENTWRRGFPSKVTGFGPEK